MSIDEQPMNVYWSGKRTETSNNFKTNYKGSVATKNNLPSSGNKKGDMYNVAESGENFIWNGSSWDNLSSDTLKTLNWQKTEKAGAVAIYPVPETVLEPVVNFLFTETPPASGDKSPDNPSTITGVTQAKVTRCGKNLIPYPFLETTNEDNGITWTDNGDGTVTANGTATALSAFFVAYPFNIPAGAYTLSGAPNGATQNAYNLYVYDANNVRYYDNDNGTPLQATAKLIGLNLRIASGVTVSNLVFKPQLELGTTATSFEPYSGDDYVIDLGSTYYGGTLDVASGVMTVNYASYVFGGNTSFSTSAGVLEFTNFYRLAIYPNPARSTKDIYASCACNILPVVSTNSDSGNYIRFGNNSSKIEVDLRKDLLNLGDGADFNTVKTAFNSFFSSYPATVVYVVSTPQTVQLTPTQILSLTQADKYTPRLNMICTDASAVQVGYAKSPIRSEYELTQAIIATEGGE